MINFRTMQTTVFTLYFALIAINPVHAQTVTVEEGKQYTNKAQSKDNLDNLMQDIQDMIDDITAKRNNFTGDIKNLEDKINAITPPVCSGANNKPTWDGSTWTCTSDNIGTFLTEANWSTSGWSGCSASCNGGTQTRSVTCSAGSACLTAKPSTVRSCNTHRCPVPKPAGCAAGDTLCQAYKDNFGRMPDKAGYDWWKENATNKDFSSEAFKKELRGGSRGNDCNSLTAAERAAAPHC